MNFLTVDVTAGIGPILSSVYGKTLATTTDHAAHLCWISIVVLALMVSALLRETKSAA